MIEYDVLAASMGIYLKEKCYPHAKYRTEYVIWKTACKKNYFFFFLELVFNT